MESDLLLKCIKDKEVHISSLESDIKGCTTKISLLKKEISTMREGIEKETLKKNGSYKRLIWLHERFDYIIVKAELLDGEVVKIEDCSDSSAKRLLSWMTAICKTYNVCIPADIYRELQVRIYQSAVNGMDPVGNDLDEWNGRKRALEMVSSRSERVFG